MYDSDSYQSLLVALESIWPCWARAVKGSYWQQDSNSYDSMTVSFSTTYLCV